MNEYETNPQRHEASSSEDPSHRSADAPRDSSSPERGQSDATAQIAPASPYQASPQPGGSAAYPAASYPTSSWQAPGQPAHPTAHPGQGTPAGQPGYAAPAAYPASPYQQGYQYQGHGQQHPYASYPGQAQGQPPYGQAQPGQAQPGQAHQGQELPGSGQPGQGQPGYGGSEQQLPIWAQPVGAPNEPRDPAQAARIRRTLITGVAAVVLAVGAGSVGAYAALAFDRQTPVTITTAGATTTKGVIDRSSLAEIAASVKDSVVSITTGTGEGSGVILSAEGYVLTNNHVVASAQGNTVKVVFADGKSATAKIVGTDPRTDLAVVKADGVTGLKPATLGVSADLQVGDTVLAIGSPLGLEGSVTEGIISAKDRTIQSSSEEQQQQQDQQSPFGGGGQQQQPATTSMSGLLQTDAAINPGNSGGALVNINGQVVGINSAIATSGGNAGNIGLGFAIPSDKAKLVAQQLMNGQKVSHPALGVSVAAAENGGAVVAAVNPNSAAARAGLQKGDIITKADGKPVNDSDDLVAIVQARKVGDTLPLTFRRNDVEKTVNATLSEAS